jgi:translation initiation factor IF-3
LNHEIKLDEVRLIDLEGNQAGVVSLKEAFRIRDEQDPKADIVELQPNAAPPVCRIMDYGKFLFQLKKKQTEAKKKQTKVQVKELKFRPGTDIGDYQVKLRNLRRFLEHGDKVKITIRFRGREMSHKELGMNMLKRLEKDVADIGAIEQHPKIEGRQMMMVIGPGKSAKATPAAKAPEVAIVKAATEDNSDA